jgi:hypothetical protein
LEITVAFAAKDSTAGKSVFINHALAIGLIRASTGLHLFDVVCPQVCSQIYQLRRGYKQPVVESDKVTTVAASPALAALLFVPTSL